MQVRFAAFAVADIEAIFRYIARDNPLAAQAMTAAIIGAADRLSLNPRLGRIGTMAGTFELTAGRYVLVYEINRSDIVVLRVWHGRQRRPGT
jgi:toxin ParE1/3/4